MKDLFNDLLDERKGLKYEITLKIKLKNKKKIEVEFSPVYLNSTTKTAINHKFGFYKSFQEILYRIDNWTNERSGWIIELNKSLYINVSTYRPLFGSSYIAFTVLKSQINGLTNIKNNDQKCFLWCHIRHINPVKIQLERITKKNEELVNNLSYNEIEFSMTEKHFSKIELKNIIFINVFCYENKLTFLIYILDRTFENSMDLLLISDENK